MRNRNLPLVRRLSRLLILILTPTVVGAQSDAAPPRLIQPLWPALDTALSVWIQPPPAGPNSDSLALALRRAVAAWNSQLPTLRMRFSADSLRSGVRVVWIDRFDEPISGRTTCVDDGAGNIVSARVVLALRHSDGRLLSAEESRVLALHELGHAIGLEHSLDSTSVMSPRVRVREISAADRARLLSLYAPR